MLSSQKLLRLAGAGAALLASGCADYLTGQPEEPQGPIQVLKLTLFDSSSRDSVVFTDTSLPDCSPVEKKTIDCTADDKRNTPICRVCYSDVFKDMYSLAKSPPTPDSGQDLRVIFNKPPFLLDGKELGVEFDPIPDCRKGETPPFMNETALPTALKLACADCAGVPPLRRFLVVSGSDVTFDPTTIPYGPSLKLTVDQRVKNPNPMKMDGSDCTLAEPRAALEPDSQYTVQVGSGVAGRDGAGYKAEAQDAALLSFKTEPFKVLSVGRTGTKADTYVYASKQQGSYTISDQPIDAAVVLRFNASLHADTLAGVMATASKSPGGASVAVKVGANVFLAKKDGVCPQDSQRLLYVYPATGNWPADATEVNIRIPSGSVFDVAQGGSFGKGKHSIASEISVTVKFAPGGKTGGTGYIKVTDAAGAGKC